MKNTTRLTSFFMVAMLVTGSMHSPSLWRTAATAAMGVAAAAQNEALTVLRHNTVPMPSSSDSSCSCGNLVFVQNEGLPVEPKLGLNQVTPPPGTKVLCNGPDNTRVLVDCMQARSQGRKVCDAAPETSGTCWLSDSPAKDTLATEAYEAVVYAFGRPCTMNPNTLLRISGTDAVGCPTTRGPLEMRIGWDSAVPNATPCALSGACPNGTFSEMWCGEKGEMVFQATDGNCPSHTDRSKCCPQLHPRSRPSIIGVIVKTPLGQWVLNALPGVTQWESAGSNTTVINQ